MTSMATRIASKGVDVVTFNFLYAEAGRKMPDRASVLETTWSAAVSAVRARKGLPTERLFIGGKSMGGRIATHVAAAADGVVASGVVLLGYPLHPLGKPQLVRDEILAVRVPLLVVQGTRDALGTAAQMQELLANKRHARVHVVEGGDHSLALPKKCGSDRQEEELERAASAIAKFIATRTRTSR
jgi:predicted alpha/beta-hydrolase family hydrolase